MILCCGEALIDMIPTPTLGGPDGFVPHSGGAIFNTAIGLGRLGVPAGIMTGLSRDMFGAQLQRDLEASNVDISHLVMSDRPTTLAFVKLTNGHAVYTFMDENSAGRMLQTADTPAPAAAVKALYFGGISLACEPGADAYADYAVQHGASRAVMIDPNIRPGFIQDADRYRARLAKMLTHADIVKVSDEDLDWIYPGAAPLADKVALLRAAGPRVVIMTKGRDGASGWLADGTEVQVAGHVVEVVDTVGAGDTFNAGVLAKLSELGVLDKAALASLSAEALTAALAHGAAVAAVTVSRAGANPPWRDELAQ